MTDFEKNSMQNALQRLLDKNIINKEQKDKLFEMYQKDPRNYSQIHQEIHSLEQDKKLLDSLLQKNITVADQSINKDNLNKDAMQTINLENIEEFKKEDNGKTYIKIHYPFPVDKVSIIEKGPSLQNYTAKEIFEEIQKKYGLDNTTTIFDHFLKEKCKEVSVDNIDEYCKQSEFNKLSLEQKNSIIAIKKVEKYKTKKITAAPTEGLFIISDPALISNDIVVSVNKKMINGNPTYVVEPVKQNTYKNNNKEEISIEENTNTIDNNEEITKQDDDIYKFEGFQKRLTRKKRKPNNEAAFVNMLWFVVLAGVICAILIAVLLTK